MGQHRESTQANTSHNLVYTIYMYKAIEVEVLVIIKITANNTQFVCALVFLSELGE